MYTNGINTYSRTLLLSTNLPETAYGNYEYDIDNLQFTDILGKEQKKLEAISSDETVDTDLVLDINNINLDSVKTDTITTATTKYDSYFQKASETYNIPTYILKAVAKQESNFQSNCVSKSGAIGIMQLMPATAASLGVTNAYDPEQNIMGGAKYLAQNLKTFNNDISLALAAYNAGPNAVKKYDGIPPYEETQNYVPKVLKYAQMYQQLEGNNNTTVLGGSITSNANNTDYTQLMQLLTSNLNNSSLSTNTSLNTALEQLMYSNNSYNWLS